MIARLLDVVTLGRRRRRRRLERQLADLDNIDNIEFLGQRVSSRRPTHSYRPGGRGRRGRSGGWRDRGLVAFAVLIAGWLTLTQQLGWHIGLDGIRGPEPLGAAPSTRGSGGFVFTSTQPGNPREPVAYSPCEPVRVVVNADLAPSGSDGIIEESLDRVSDLTGLQFRLEGETDEVPGVRARGEGDPVLIAWTTPEQVPELGGDVAGLGGSTSIRRRSGGLARYVTGQVSLDAPQLVAVMDRSDGRSQVRAIVLHELGHLVGLDHVPDPNQLMYEENVGVDDFAAGDRRGLARLGRGSCAQF